MSEELLPDIPAEDNNENLQPDSGEHQHRQKRRVRKRIRIKKKVSPVKKLKKIGEKLLWLLIIFGFIATLVIMVKQLNIVDEKEKNRKAKSPSMNSFPVSEFKYS